AVPGRGRQRPLRLRRRRAPPGAGRRMRGPDLPGRRRRRPAARPRQPAAGRRRGLGAAARGGTGAGVGAAGARGRPRVLSGTGLRSLRHAAGLPSRPALIRAAEWTRRPVHQRAVDMSSLYAVFGHPVGHSLSPRIHATFGRQTGIALRYEAIDATPEEFPRALDAFATAGGAGANVTLPHKQAAYALCATVTERARRAGAVNTLARSAEGWH